MRSRVVLPAPFGPSTTSDLAGRELGRDARERDPFAVVAAQPVSVRSPCSRADSRRVALGRLCARCALAQEPGWQTGRCRSGRPSPVTSRRSRRSSSAPTASTSSGSACGPARWTTTTRSRCAAASSHVAEDGGRGRRTARPGRERDHLLIENVAVDPDRQGEGIGRRLLDHAEEGRARAQGSPGPPLHPREDEREPRALRPPRLPRRTNGAR